MAMQVSGPTRSDLHMFATSECGVFIPRWQCIKKEDAQPTNFEGKRVEFKPFVKPNEAFISYEELKIRAVKLKGDKGFSDAEWLLDHLDLIPEDFQNPNYEEQKYIVFPGAAIVHSNRKSKWQPNGLVTVPMVYWENGGYGFHPGWRGKWCERGRLLVVSE